MTLSPMQARVVRYVVLGHSDQEIGDLCHMTRDVAKSHLQAVYKKLNISNSWGNPRVRLLLWSMGEEGQGVLATQLRGGSAINECVQ